MKNGKLNLKYDIYIAAPANKVWKALTDGSQTKQYFYGGRVTSSFKKGDPIAYLGDGEFNLLDGEVREVTPEKRLVTTFQAVGTMIMSARTSHPESLGTSHPSETPQKSHWCTIDLPGKQQPTSNPRMAGTSFPR